jgi:hypothetical protein
VSFLFGHHKSVKPDYTGLALQTSSSAVPIAIGYGLNRVAPNIVWQGDFKAHKQTQGGKGFGGTVTGYKYSGSYVLSLGWGPSGGVINTWKDQSKTAGYSSLGFTFIAGNVPQSPWGYLTTAHPSQAIGYAGLILMCVPNLDLGGSNTLPQFSFETKWPLYNTAPGGKGDADPAQCIDSFLNSNLYGALIGFPMQVDLLFSTGAAPTTGDNAFQTYCKALGFGFSPLQDSQETAKDILTRWTTIFNADLGWTGYSMSILCRGADTVTGNGVTYLPDNTLEFALTDANGDFIYSSGQDPVRLQRARRSTLPNYGYLEITNRENDYNTEPANWFDQGLIDEFGPNPDNSFTAHEICEPSIGAVCATLYGQRLCYTPNQFEFTTGPGFMAYVVGSKGTIDDPKFGVQTVRVVDMEEQDDGSFSVLAEEYDGAVSSVSSPSQEPSVTTPVNTEVAAAAVNTPIIFEPPSTLAGSTAQVWMAVSAGPSGAFDPNWGGCLVYLSSDGVSFGEPVGEIDFASRMGVLSGSLASYGGTNPDTTHSVNVDLTESDGELLGVSAADAAAFATLSIIKDAGGAVEFLSFRDATLVSGNVYTVGGQLYRGLYGSAAGAHVAGAAFARLDDNIFKFELPVGDIGRTIYVKLQSFNIFGGGVQDLSTCTVYSYTPAGTGYGGGAGGVPTTPAGLSATPSGNGNVLGWTANPASDNVTGYLIFRANGSGASFGSASQIGASGSTAYTDATAAPGAAYTYFIEAKNAVGPSTNSAGVSVTTAQPNPQSNGITASVNLTAGQIVNIFSSGGAAKVQPADVADDSKPADGFVLASVTAGNPATVYGVGSVITGLSALTPGATYWLAASGGLTATLPTSGWAQLIGKALSATTLLFDPQQGNLL